MFIEHYYSHLLNGTVASASEVSPFNPDQTNIIIAVTPNLDVRNIAIRVGETSIVVSPDGLHIHTMRHGEDLKTASISDLRTRIRANYDDAQERSKLPGNDVSWWQGYRAGLDDSIRILNKWEFDNEN